MQHSSNNKIWTCPFMVYRTECHLLLHRIFLSIMLDAVNIHLALGFSLVRYNGAKANKNKMIKLLELPQSILLHSNHVCFFNENEIWLYDTYIPTIDYSPTSILLKSSTLWSVGAASALINQVGKKLKASCPCSAVSGTCHSIKIPNRI